MMHWADTVTHSIERILCFHRNLNCGLVRSQIISLQRVIVL